MKRGVMMLTFKRRFTAFFLPILMFSILSLDSPASYPEEIDNFQHQRSNHTDGDVGHASGEGAFDSDVPISPHIAGGGSHDNGTSDIMSLNRISQSPKRKTHEIRSAKPRDVLNF